MKLFKYESNKFVQRYQIVIKCLGCFDLFSELQIVQFDRNNLNIYFLNSWNKNMNFRRLPNIHLKEKTLTINKLKQKRQM